MSHRVTFVTPTYAYDFERFCLQRESIERFDIDISQVAVVQDEDRSLFDTVSCRKNLTIVSTSDVLPSEIEKRRFRKSASTPTSDPIKGWLTQQLVKLASPLIAETNGIVCLDSDVFFLHHVTCEDFYASDGRLHLVEIEVDYSEWFNDSWRFLGMSNECMRHYNYVFMLVPFHRQVLLDLQSFIAAKYNEHWAEAILQHGVTEYMTYGVFARQINQLRSLVPTPSTLCFTYWPGMQRMIKRTFQVQIDKHQAKAASIQSSIGWPVSCYRALVEQIWGDRSWEH